MQTAYQWTGHWNYSKNDIAQTVFAEYLCYRNTLHKLQDYVAVNSINQYHIFIHTNSVEVLKYECGIKQRIKGYEER